MAAAPPPVTEKAPAEASAHQPDPKKWWPLAIAALGVVFGDIGTSPLYAVKECFSGLHPLPVNHENVMGILSLFFLALFMVVAFKYLVFIMKADNKGEGGLFALLALIPQHLDARSTRLKAVVVMGALFGAALLYGDGIITPAISVLSAVEGLGIAAPVLKPFILPVTITVLISLFVIQRFGTGSVGKFFGPVMVLWFAVLAGLGVANISRYPQVLAAINPLWAIEFVIEHRFVAFITLGAVVLTITGGEALYADMGHFGRRPIRRAWFYAVFPALLLNYCGQGALLLTDPAAVENPFFRLAPQWALLPLVMLATLATVIASQAVISGVFSITRQAIQLGYLPRLDV